MRQTSTKLVKCNSDLMLVSKEEGMDDLPEEVSAEGERATLKSPPTIKHGPPKVDNLVRVEERKHL